MRNSILLLWLVSFNAVAWPSDQYLNMQLQELKTINRFLSASHTPTFTPALTCNLPVSFSKDIGNDVERDARSLQACKENFVKLCPQYTVTDEILYASDSLVVFKILRRK